MEKEQKSENKKPPISKVLLSMVGLFVFCTLIFTGMTVLVSDVSFAKAFIVIGIGFAVLLAIALFWGYVIDDMWFSKLPTKTQEKIRNWSIGLLLLAFFVGVPMGMIGGDSWSGEGVVNIFPEGATSKNYRVAAEMEVETKWLWQKEYKIESVLWDGGGNTDFENCTIDKSNKKCSDEEGRVWRIEIVETPEKASSEDY